MIRGNDGRVVMALVIVLVYGMVGFLTPVAQCASSEDKKQDAASKSEPKSRKVKAFVQPKPGKPREEFEMTVHPAPVGLPLVSGDEVELEDDDIVLGVEVEGLEVAYPIRYLSMFEVVNSKVGDTPIAPSW